MNVLIVVLSLCCAQSAAARRVAREVVESFGREAVEAAEPRVARLVEAYGEEAVSVLRKVGPSGVQAMERFGAPSLKILARWGDDGVRLLAVEGESAVAAMAKYGDEAVELMIRHPGVGRDLLAQFGGQVLRRSLTTDSVVTLNRLAEPIRASGRSAEILAVVEKFGDRACEFLWRNKGTIFLAAVLTAFLNDPQPYLDGVKQLVVQPATQVAHDAASRTNWTLVVLVTTLFIATWLGLRWSWAARRSRPVSP
ncbi:MAG TPA: hypothetical protein VNM14_02475 [Planctomycetota bacterium]|jgi:hypothetical protein|nr:hypothetical protein [Planctomycetota bacterium]